MLHNDTTERSDDHIIVAIKLSERGQQLLHWAISRSQPGDVIYVLHVVPRSSKKRRVRNDKALSPAEMTNGIRSRSEHQGSVSKYRHVAEQPRLGVGSLNRRLPVCFAGARHHLFWDCCDSELTDTRLPPHFHLFLS